MLRTELRDFWLDADPAILCKMIDGSIAMLIIGPSDDAVARGDWRFGFQVRGETDIRWLQAEQLEREGRALVQRC